METEKNKQILNFKVKECLKCKAKTSLVDTKEFFCSQCGAPVLNRCANYECQEILDEKSKYCKYCGSPTLFKNYGLLDTSNIDDDLPF